MDKVNIVWNVKDGAFGGGNQFLKRLKDQFVLMGNYSNPEKADVFLFNSHHEMENVRELKRRYPNKKFIHRVDGPMRLYNHKDDPRDDLVVSINKLADGIVFQSKWSREETVRMYPSLAKKPSATIHNACDLKRRRKELQGKIKIVAVSMSDNVNKGYKIYSYLDDNMDFNKYGFSFVGRSPVLWKNINDLGLKTPEEVVGILADHDIFITASKNDPCSNALIEALSVDLPALVLNSGGHPEIVKKGGVLFNGIADVMGKIEELIQYKDCYEKGIDVSTMTKAALSYLAFFEEIKG